MLRFVWFLVRRFGEMVLTLLVVFTISFFLMRAVPGGPFDSEKQLTAGIRRNVEARYHLDKPWYQQYWFHLTNAVRLDLGPSYRLEDYTVNEIIEEGFPVSASLGIFALVFAITIGISAGVLSAMSRNTLFDYAMMAGATVGVAIPNFVLASLAVVLFVFILGLFPAAGWGTLRQIVLPAVFLGMPFAAYIARLTRAGMLEVLSRDYIRTAYAKGLRNRQVIMRHALRGAILPVVSYLGPAVAGILTGSLVLERIFVLPGMGSHFVEAALQRDYTVAMGMVLVYTLLLFTMNTLVDVSYGFIDPRVKAD